MTAAFLIRCSTKRQDYQRQINDLTLVANRFGYEYSDETIYGEHITGKDDATVRDRDSIKRLKEDALAGKFDIVLVSEVSRMSRDPISGRWYVRELINWKIPVYFKDIDTWTFEPGTEQVASKIKEKEAIIGASFDAAWKYLKSMKTQIASGRRNELFNNCISVGKPFFGYKRFGGKDKSNKNSLIIDEENSKIVVDIFNEYLKDGGTLKSTSMAISSKYGIRFSTGSINHILDYESYASGEKVYTLKDPDTEVVDSFKIKMPVIIPMELFNAVQVKKKGNRVRREPYPSQKTYLLSKLLKCPDCGYTMTPKKKSNGYGTFGWVCMSGVNNKTECKNRIAIANDKIESVVWGLVKKELIVFSRMDNDEKRAKIAEIKAKIEDLEGKIHLYLAENEGKKKLIDRSYRVYMDAPEDIIEAVKSDYYNTVTRCNKEIKANEAIISGLKDEISKMERLLVYYSSPNISNDIIDRAENDFILKRRLVLELIEKIIPYKITTYKGKYGLLRYGVLLLEAHTINNIYYILYNANEGKYAYYLSSEIIFSKSKFATDYIKGLGNEVFYIKSPYLYNKEGDDAIIDINEFVKLAELGDNIIEIKKASD